MNSELTHPDSGDLLLYRDGDLPVRELNALRSHLNTCGECRGWLEQLDDVESLYASYDEDVFCGRVPAPPRAWSLKLDEPARRSARWWWAVAAAIAICAIVYRTYREPVVNAGELLQKAAIAEPGAVGGLLVRVGSRRFERSTGDCCAGDPVRVLFVSAHYSWTNPLSARSFSTWRDGLARKSDRVSTSGTAYEVETSTPEGVLARASLTLDRSTLRASRGVWQFRDAETVEISQAAASAVQPSRSDVAVPEVSVPAAPRMVEPSNRPVVAGASEELHAISALHELGADLGEPIEVGSPEGQGIVVTVIGATVERESQIRDALSGIPGVVVRFRGGNAASPAAKAAPPSVTATAGMTPFQMRLMNRLGDPDAVDRFTNNALEWSDTITARAHALSDLARRFPAATENALEPPDRTMLAGLRSAHEAALSAAVMKLNAALEPYVGSVPAGAVPDASWQQRAAVVLARARTLDTVLSQTLAGSDQDGAAEQRLKAALAGLRSAVEASGR